jgi:glutathione S-transferase
MGCHEQRSKAMSEPITFYTNPMSRGRIARWMLEEIGVPYDTVVLEYGTTMKAPEYLALNPMGKVPALKHGEAVVTECAAICAYLADAFPESQLAPAIGDPRRGAYLRWMFYAAGPVEAMTSNQALGVVVPDDKRGMVGYGSREAVVDALETAVSPGPYILGDMFSAVDVYLGSQLGWGTQFGTIEKRPAFVDYLGRIMSRPAAVRAREIDDGLIAKAKES